MVKRIVTSLLVTLLQTITYIVLVLLFGLLFDLISHEGFKSFFFLGLMYVTFFAIPGLLFNFLAAIVGQKWFNYLSIGIPLILYIIGWAEDIYQWPLQTVFYLIIGTIGYLSKLYFDKQLKKGNTLKGK